MYIGVVLLLEGGQIDEVRRFGQRLDGIGTTGDQNSFFEDRGRPGRLGDAGIRFIGVGRVDSG